MWCWFRTVLYIWSNTRGKALLVALLWGLISLCPVGLMAQKGGLIHYSVTDGLPSSEVHDVEQDDNGLIWIATDRGLCSFDGYDFRVYGPEDGMYEQAVWRILKDGYGRLWFIGLSGKLHYYQNGDFHSFQGNDTIDALQFGDLRTLSYSMHNGVLYINRKKLILKISLETLELTLEDLSAYEEGYVHVVPKEKGGFVLQNEGMYQMRWADTTWTVETDQGKLAQWVILNPVILGDECLVSTQYQVVLLSKLTKKAKVLSRGSPPSSMEVNRNGRVYICLKNTILSYEKGRIDTIQLLEDHLRIAGQYEDHEGGRWIATLNDGLYYRPGTKVNHIQTNSSTEAVFHFVEADGEVFLGVSKQGYFQVNKKENRFVVKRKNLLKHFQNKVLDYGGGNYKGSSPLWGYSWTNAILMVPKVVHGKLCWVSSGQLMITDTTGRTISLSEIDGIRTYDVEYFQDQWMIATTEGLYSYDGSKAIDLGDQFEKLSGRVADVLVMDSLMYLATIGQGLLVFNGKSVRSYKTSNSNMPSNSCSHLHVDSMGNMWVSTTNGLVRTSKKGIDTGNSSFTVYGIEDGLASNEVLTTYSMGAELLIGGKGGLDVLKIEEEESLEPGQYHLQVNYMSIDGKEVDLEGDMTLSSDQNDIEIGFKGICYRCLGDLEYSYRILGLSDQWFSTRSTSIDQFNLGYGDYTLELKCKGYKLEESEVVKLHFFILPPFYLQAWFLLLVSAVLGGIAFAIARNVVVRRKLNRKLQQYQYATFTAQLNPHFIFNTLNAIQSLFLKREVKEGVNYMSSFGKLLRGILQNPSHELVNLRDELELMSNYVELERIRMRASLVYQEDLQLRDAKEQIMVPPMLFQPLVENSINHGIMPKKGGTVSIRIKQLSEKLHIEVQDDGVGVKHAKPKKTKDRPSYGLKLVRERVNLINRMQGVKCDFEVQDLSDLNGEGTLIKFCIPLIIDKEHT